MVILEKKNRPVLKQLVTSMLDNDYNEHVLRIWRDLMDKIKNVCVCVPMPTHCTIMRFGFYARWIDGVKCDLFSNHAPLGQTTLHVGRVSV